MLFLLVRHNIQIPKFHYGIEFYFLKFQLSESFMTDIEFHICQEDIEWIKKYLKNAAPSGNEICGQKMWLDYVKPYVDDYITDAYGMLQRSLIPLQNLK
jgi:hypothetical protein